MGGFVAVFVLYYRKLNIFECVVQNQGSVPVPATTVQEERYTLDRSSVHHRVIPETNETNHGRSYGQFRINPT